jgi:integrase
VTHYTEKELPNKTPYTRKVYEGYISKWILPKWGNCPLSDVRTVAAETWLGSLKLANGSRAKDRNIFSALYAHAMRWEFFDKNPITLVRQSAKRQQNPEMLTADELKALLGELTGLYWAMVYVAATTGLRVSELLALRWQDCDFEREKSVSVVASLRQNIGEMKTEASRKPVPMEAGLAEVLTNWRGQCAYNQL